MTGPTYLLTPPSFFLLFVCCVLPSVRRSVAIFVGFLLCPFPCGRFLTLKKTTPPPPHNNTTHTHTYNKKVGIPHTNTTRARVSTYTHHCHPPVCVCDGELSCVVCDSNSILFILILMEIEGTELHTTRDHTTTTLTTRDTTRRLLSACYRYIRTTSTVSWC